MEAIKDIIINVVQDLSTRKLGKNNDAPEEWLKKLLTKKRNMVYWHTLRFWLQLKVRWITVS